jgi:hypothetical protein
MMKTLDLLAAFLLCQTSFAQFSDSTHHYIGLIASGSANQTDDGNSYLLNNALKFGVKKKSISLNATNSWVYGKQNEGLTNNDFSSSVDFNIFQTPQFYYWGLANYNTSVSLKINNQLLTGLGLAYSVIESKNAYLNFSDGILYDKSDLYLQDTIRDVYDTFRNSFRVSFRFALKELAVLDGSSYIQNSLNYKNDYIIRSNVNLSFKIRKWLSLTTSLNYNRINRTQRENMLVSYGLKAEKYW